MYKSKEMTAWQHMVGYTIKSRYKRLQKLIVPVYVSITMYIQRDRDIDSSVKGTLDALEGVVYENDAQVCHLEVIKEMEIKKPRLEITVCSV